MSLVACNGSNTNDSTATDITYQVYNPQKTWYDRTCSDSEGNTWDCGYWIPGYDDYDGTSTVRGTVSASIANVYVNGKKIARQNDSVTETEQANVPGNAVNIRNADGGTGRVSNGNSSRVYAGGVLVAVVGSSVTTHAGGSTTIKDGSTNVYIT
ncbi:putative Zn-binding protein involved in type VI secretion [Paenibacillus sp. LBL]|uniref:hypothetical protein n=1 Tax=Paenibacillus sp. LBL TaxID=2940563 RepID=UPI002473824D|nr:hypothetical protein [Paenibacillus sp. LBL]MDH6674231.1 putative Zn-binding protein involved in type VI secretion [Paenibacillus sp. LBL]